MAGTADVATLELSAALSVNERTEPLLDGSVSPDAIRLVATGVHPSEMFWRQLKFAEFDVSEMSIASLMIATAREPTPWVALPVFTSRNFFHTRVLVRTAAGIEKPEDLRGKRVGVAEYQQTAAVWSRGILKDEFGVDPAEIEWFMERTPERSHGGVTGFTPPPGVRFHHISPETDLGAMLLADELDALLVYLPVRNLVDRSRADLTRDPRAHLLFPDAGAEGRRFYAKTGMYPINHCTVVRRSLVERHPWVVLNVYNAFLAAKELIAERRNESLRPYWETGVLNGTTREALVQDPMAYGVRAARPVLETIGRYLLEQGLTPRRVGLEEIFAPNTLDL
jgi:4,5-dihydroxyphthalate decarboxylase